MKGILFPLKDLGFMIPDVVIGNPPFLGGGRIRTERGDHYVTFLKEKFARNCNLKADYSCFWILKCLDLKPKRVGFVMPNNITSNNSREVGLEKILATKGKIFFALPSSSWLGSASVFITIVCFGWDAYLPDAYDSRLNPRKQVSWNWEFTQPSEDELRALSCEVEKIMISIESYRKKVCMERKIGLTTLYNEMLINKKHLELRALHRDLDEKVAMMYNFPLEYLNDEKAIIDFLSKLNKKRYEEEVTC